MKKQLVVITAIVVMICCSNLKAMKEEAITPLTDLTPAQISMLRLGRLQRLRSAELRALTPSQLRALRPAQLRELTPTQIRWLTTGQVKVLTPTQLRALTPAQTQALELQRPVAEAPPWSGKPIDVRPTTTRSGFGGTGQLN